MTFKEALVALLAKYPQAGISPSVRTGSGFDRAAKIAFAKGKNGTYSGRDADGTEVLLYYNDTADVIACTELEPDVEPGVEADVG